MEICAKGDFSGCPRSGWAITIALGIIYISEVSSMVKGLFSLFLGVLFMTSVADADGKIVTTSSGLRYEEVLLGTGSQAKSGQTEFKSNKCQIRHLQK